MNTFKRKSLYAALAGLSALGVTGAAQAVNVNPDGLGQVLLYPYYTVRSINGNAYNTLLSVVNSTGSVKAVKVRFLEGKNSREVLDFNLYLSPYDVWTAALLQTSTGAMIKTDDTSCTVPPIPAGGQEFVNYAYAGSSVDGSTTSLDRTREGYFEIIEMGVITQATYAAYATHTASWARGAIPLSVPLDPTVAFNCNGIVNADGSGVMSGYVVAPTGGLFGGETLVNVFDGTDYTADPVALDAFTATPLWYQSGLTNPSLAQVNPKVSTVFASYGSSLTTEMVQTSWTLPGSNAVDPVSAVLLHENVMNEYVVDPAQSSAGTDWVVTFPTKRFYYPIRWIWSDGSITLQVEALFQRNYNDGACDNVGLYLYDREERGPTTTVQFSPQLTSTPQICWEANVVTFNNSAVFGSTNVRNVPTPVPGGTPAGWMRINFPSGASSIYLGSYHTLVGGTTTRTSPAGTVTTASLATYFGLPTIGFAAHRYTYNNMPTATGTVLSNYGGTFIHKGNRRIN